jgi:hypothetical protein
MAVMALDTANLNNVLFLLWHVVRRAGRDADLAVRTPVLFHHRRRLEHGGGDDRAERYERAVLAGEEVLAPADPSHARSHAHILV